MQHIIFIIKYCKELIFNSNIEFAIIFVEYIQNGIKKINNTISIAY